jgi:hypothetical protein
MKVKKEDKLKQLLLTWWVWVIIALVFYVIFVLVPLESNAKLWFAYLTQIAWIIVVALIGISIIKWIQRSKLGDYWKISFTILGIIGIIAYVIYSLSGLGIFGADTDFLEDQGYEVLYFGCQEDYLGIPSLEMKSFGNREDQVIDGLIHLTNKCPNAQDYYSIRIVEPTQECGYLIESEIVDSYFFALDKDFWDEPYEIDEITIRNTIAYLSWVNFVNSEDASFNDQFYYLDMMDNGITLSTLHSILYYEIEHGENCE